MDGVECFKQLWKKAPLTYARQFSISSENSAQTMLTQNHEEVHEASCESVIHAIRERNRRRCLLTLQTPSISQ